MSKIPVGLQLFSVRNEIEKDMKGTLQAVAQMGYAGVEFFSYQKRPAGELRAMLDEYGLACCGWHIPFELVQDDKLDGSIEFCKALGNKFLIVPWIPEEVRKTKDDWKAVAGFFNDRAKKLADHGMYIGYHNHDMEFKVVDGEVPWDIFISNTEKGVIMQLDTGNALHGGAWSVPILAKYPGRARTLHIKPYSVKEGYRPLIGQDDLQWPEILSLCEAGGTEWYIIEYESDAYAPLTAVEKCLGSLKAILD